MERHPNDFHNQLQQILSQESKPIQSEEEIHFDVLAMKVMKVMEVVGDRWVVWLN